DILSGGLRGALNLAASGQLSVADAAETTSAALVQFKLKGKDAGHVADLLAAGAGKAMGSVGDMGQALKQSGVVASQFGVSIEETVGTLAAFASTGMIGAEAGTGFKSMLLALAKPSREAQRAMDELGISAYDAEGQFVGITN
ncbi:phage tail tape measure protein, partial [Clostridioides difficile]|uniref:phage tail tape measure protein n=2 Tax=Bacillati TaxID=1783272 RepID=UPI0031B5BBB3